MNLNEFESQTRDVIEQTLNQLHTTTLLIAQLESQVSETGKTVQALSHLVETFVAQQKDANRPESAED